MKELFFYHFFQAINIVGDQTLLLGEKGEKLRWFLLPSEAAQLLSGKQLTQYPMTAPFTPLQWKNGVCVPERTNLTGADNMEPSERTSFISPKQSPSKLSEINTTSGENLKGSKFVSDAADCSCLANGEIGERNDGRSFCSGGKCDDCAEGRDMSATKDLKKDQVPVANFDDKSFEDDKCHSARLETKNMDSIRGDKELCLERKNDEVYVGLDETALLQFSKDEKTLKIGTVNEKSNNGRNNGSTALINNEKDREGSKTVDQASSTNTSEEILITKNGDSVTNAEVVCGRKPRKKKQNEVIPGKPQFHHPPKSIFKPAAQV